MAKSGMDTGNGSPITSQPVSRLRPGENSFNAPLATIRIEEIPGSTYNSLEEAQRALLPGLARLLVQAVRVGLETGKLKVENHQIVWADETNSL